MRPGSGRLVVLLALLRSFRRLELIEALLDPLERRLHLVIAVPGLRTPLVDQEAREHDERRQLEELRLPVLERPLRPDPAVPVVAQERRVRTVLSLLGGVLEPAGDRVPHEAPEEEDGERDAQPVVAPESLHHRISPAPVRAAMSRSTRFSTFAMRRARASWTSFDSGLPRWMR